MSPNFEIPPRVCPRCQRENLPFAPHCVCGQDLGSATVQPAPGIAPGLGKVPLSSVQPGSSARPDPGLSPSLGLSQGQGLPVDTGLWPGLDAPAGPGFQFANATPPRANRARTSGRRPRALLVAMVLAIGAVVVLVPAAFLGGQGSAQAEPAASTSPSVSTGSPSAPGSSAAPSAGSTPSAIGSASPAPAASGETPGSLRAARLDAGDWTITQTVTASTLDTAQVGDQTRRVYAATYNCAAPPCDLKVTARDPDSLAAAVTSTFSYADGTYTAQEPPETDRCILGDGEALADAYQVQITTSIQATTAKQAKGHLVATHLEGNQLREGEPTASAARAGCKPWRIELSTRGQAGDSGTPRISSSVNWSGYHVGRHGAQFTNVEGTWVQPAVSCQSVHRQMASFWVGIDGVRSHTLQQIGTSSECLDQRQDLYYAWWEMLPAPMVRISMLIRPGDTIHAQVSFSGSRFTLSITNETTEGTFSIVRSNPKAKRATAEWVAEATSMCGRTACQVSALPDFDSVRFTKCDATAGGRTALLGDALWTRSLDQMIEGSHRTTLKAQPSAIDAGSDGFTVSWRSVGP